MHAKHSSIITDENVQERFKKYLRELNINDRCPKKFRDDYNAGVLKMNDHAPNTISLRTTNVWMHVLGFTADKAAKGYYTDSK